MTPVFYAIGNTIIDIFIKVPALPVEYSRTEVTFVEPEVMDSIIDRYSVGFSNNVIYRTGGVTTNIIKTAASLGAKTFFSTSISSDKYKDIFFEEMKHYNILPFYDTVLKSASRYLTLIGPRDKNGRPICVSLLSLPKTETVSPTVLRVPYLLNADLVFTEDITVMNKDTWDFIIFNCKKAKKNLVMDLIGPIEIITQTFSSIIENANSFQLFLIFNKAESECFKKYLKETKNQNYEEFTTKQDRMEFAPCILEMENDKGADFWISGEQLHVDYPKVEVLDYTGASEVFAGSFFTRWISASRDKSNPVRKRPVIEDCLKFASGNIVQILKSFGCTP